MKKIVSLMLVLALSLTAAYAALAAVRDAMPITQGDGYQINTAVVIGDTIYMKGWNEMLTYKLGDDRPTDAVFDNTVEGDCRVLLEKDGQLYGLFELWQENGGPTASVAPINLVDGVYTPGEMLPLDWSKMSVEEAEYTYTRDYDDARIVGDEIYILTSGDDRDRMFNMLLAFSMTDGSCRVVADLLKITSAVEYKDGLMLATGYDGEMQWDSKGIIGTLDPATGTFTKAMEVDAQAYNLYGLAYDAETDSVYYVTNGQLNRAKGLDPSTAQVVNSMPVSNNGSMQRTGRLIDGGMYMFYSYDTMVIRNVNPDTLPERILVVRTYQEPGAGYYAFEKAHPEVLVSLDNSYSPGDDVTSAMMNRDGKVDIYALQTNSSALSALKGRGFLAPIENEGIKTFASRLYPAVQEALSMNGQLVAVPTMMGEQAALTYNVDVMNKLGLTEDDLPRTWSELIDFAERWGNDYLVNFPELSLFEPSEMPNIRRLLLNRILSEYTGYMEFHGLERFDSPILRETLNKLDQADFSSIETEESDSYSWDGETVLFGSWGTLGFSEWGQYEKEVTWPLSFVEGEAPIARMTLYVSFVNPFSENRDIAEEYLRLQVENMNQAMLTTLSPEANEPFRDSYYAQNMRDMNKYLEELKKMRDVAAPEDKAGFDAQITEYETYIKEAENRWAASPEDIAKYRALAENLIISTMTGFGYGDSEDIEALFSRYTAKQIPTEQFISSLDQKLRMMQMEGY